MISVTEAFVRVLATARPLPAETVPLAAAAGRILREPLRADRDFPPFDRVSMDGIALPQQRRQTGRGHAGQVLDVERDQPGVDQGGDLGAAAGRADRAHQVQRLGAQIVWQLFHDRLRCAPF
ncbi:MAG: hypothetical protein H7Z39_04455 [Burkholderiaceae bacterium]|nr:hypothetical protein [Burkholderiaceae bacterium]